MTYQIKGSLYVGKSIPISNEYLTKNYDKLLDFIDEFSKYYRKKYRLFDLDEIKSKVMEIVVNRCGDLVYNIEYAPSNLKSCLYKKCEKGLTIFKYSKYFERLTDFHESSYEERKIAKMRQIGDLDELEFESESKLKLEKWNITEEEKYLLNILSQTLESGFDQIESFEIVADKMDMDLDLLLKKIDKIKQKNEYIVVNNKSNKNFENQEIKRNEIGEER